MQQRRSHGDRNRDSRLLQALPQRHGIRLGGKELTQLEEKWAVEDLLDRYVQCLDEDRLEEWQEFFTDNTVYRVRTRENADRGYMLATMSSQSKGIVIDRVDAILNASVF